jgi:phosphoribosylformylglycinamidine synthase
VLGEPADTSRLLTDMLARPNICSKEWIYRQYDHEVQGTSVIKPLVGAGRDVNSDAAVIRPVLDSQRGLGIAQALLPAYSAIDAYHMTACSIDEAVRRLLAVGGTLGHVGGVDNFCWPSIQYDPESNPDGRFKAAQLVRSCRALKEMCLAYGIPLLSGKDSMYVDGNLPGRYGEVHRVSALETLQFTTIGVIDDVARCVTMDCKQPDDLVFLLGVTRNELGASEYYEHLGLTGRNVPSVRPQEFLKLYSALEEALRRQLAASVHGVYRGGLAVHLALTAIGGKLGLQVALDAVPREGVSRSDRVLFSESAGRFVVTVAPDNRAPFEEIFDGLPCACVGRVLEKPVLTIDGLDGRNRVSVSVKELTAAWKRPFNDLI